MWPRLLLVVCSVRSKTIILVFRYYSREHWFLWTSDPQFVTFTAARKRLWHSPSSSDFVCDQKEKTEHVSKLVTVFTKLHMRALAYSIQGMQAEGPKELTKKQKHLSKHTIFTCRCQVLTLSHLIDEEVEVDKGQEGCPDSQILTASNGRGGTKTSSFLSLASTPLDYHCTGGGLPTHLIWSDKEQNLRGGGWWYL